MLTKNVNDPSIQNTHNLTFLRTNNKNQQRLQKQHLVTTHNESVQQHNKYHA